MAVLLEKSAMKSRIYIDGNNLHRGVLDLGWRMDYKRFGSYLRFKYSADKIYIFLGFIATNAHLYQDLQEWGYTVILKPTVPDGTGRVKGNCDAELVLQATSDFYERTFDSSIIVSSDGDFACLVNFLKDKGKRVQIFSPNRKSCSILLKRTGVSITYLEELRGKLKYEKRK